MLKNACSARYSESLILTKIATEDRPYFKLFLSLVWAGLFLKSFRVRPEKYCINIEKWLGTTPLGHVKTPYLAKENNE